MRDAAGDGYGRRGDAAERLRPYPLPLRENDPGGDRAVCIVKLQVTGLVVRVTACSRWSAAGVHGEDRLAGRPTGLSDSAAPAVRGHPRSVAVLNLRARIQAVVLACDARLIRAGG